MMNKKLISIHLNSNNSLNFEEFIFSIIENTTNIDSIEILVSIDLGDNFMKESIKKINHKYPNLIKYIETDLIKTFADAWRPLNLLFDETSSSVRYISCMSDDLRFKTEGWDKIILG